MSCSKKTYIHASLTVTVHEPHVVQQRPLGKVPSPSRGGRSSPPGAANDRPTASFALDDGPIDSPGGFYFHQPFAAVGHFDQEVRHDVARAGVFLVVLRGEAGGLSRIWISTGSFRASPRVPDRQRLLLDVNHLRAGNQDDGRRRLELALAADRAALLADMAPGGKSPVYAAGGEKSKGRTIDSCVGHERSSCLAMTRWTVQADSCCLAASA